MLLVECAEKIGKEKYEEFAEYWWGNKAAKLVGVCNLFTLLGAVTSFMVFIKTLAPLLLTMVLGSEVPEMLGSEQFKGQAVWGVMIMIALIIPLWLARKVGSLEYISSLSIISAIYLTLCLILIFFNDKKLVPNVGDNISKASYFTVSFEGISSSIPFVVFSYMYQPCLPLIYHELQNKNKFRMRKVIIIASILVIILYSIESSVGYLGVVGNPNLLETLLNRKNVLEIDYNNTVFSVSVLVIFFAAITTIPIIMLPAKNDFEAVVFGKNTMTKWQNLIVTISLCVICTILAISVPQISDAITVLGWTTFPFSGFLLPIIFFLKIYKNEPNKNWKLRLEIVLCWMIFVFITIISIINLILFILNKVN